MEFLGFSPKAHGLKPVCGFCERVPGLKAGATGPAKASEFHRGSVAWDVATGLGLKICLNSPELELGVAWQIHMDFLGFSPKSLGLKPV